MKIRTPNEELPTFSTLSASAAAVEERAGNPASAGKAEKTLPFTLIDSADKDPLIREILEEDAQGLKTPLELMKTYADVLNRETSAGDIDDKLDRLFLYGRTPPALDGYYHGVTLTLRTGTGLQELLERMAGKVGLGPSIDPLQVIYGRLLSKASPWAGKSFTMLSREKFSRLTDGFEQGAEAAFLGINSFRKAHRDYVNNLSGQVLSLIIDMEDVPGPESKQRSWIYAKGGLFIAQRRKSVGPRHPEKEVLSLNYRWKDLGNQFPNRLLIDELVQIAEGLYLGKLFYATSLRRILHDFDPLIEKEDHKYRCFGYFLLMDDRWLHEKNRLFPELAYRLADDLPRKLTTFQLDGSPQSAAIQRSLPSGKTVLHHLQKLSEGVKDGTESQQRCLQKMHELFLCGQKPLGIDGFLHGGVAAFRSSGFFKKLGRNILNDLWPSVRPFSPWTGKTFAETTPEALEEYIGRDARHYRGVQPILLGTNTYRRGLDLSLPAVAFVEHLGKVGMVVEHPDEAEKEEGIYVKSFFFVAGYGKSFDPGCRGKEVLQFNYRWPEFHTMPPDNFCIDELVRIAEGLYLGQLLYATNLGLEYDPARPASDYQYENFGYFMLMDDDWWAIKEFIRFDTE